MPFEPPYRQFERGDLVYGLRDQRSKYIKSLFQGGVVMEQFYILENEQTRSAKFPPDLRVAGFQNALRDHPKWREVLGQGQSNANIRMKDKGGLWWATTNGLHVNFILDGLNIEQVVKKSYDPGKIGLNQNVNMGADFKSENDKYRNVTGSELRWIYRHQFIKEVWTLIQFWYGQEPVCPPWVSYYRTVTAEDVARAVESGYEFDRKPRMLPGGPLWNAYTPQFASDGTGRATLAGYASYAPYVVLNPPAK